MNDSFERLSRRSNLTKEEKDMIEKCRRYNARFGFDFKEGWLVDFYVHSCGHKEILQIPAHYTKKQLREDSKKHKCSACCSGKNK